MKAYIDTAVVVAALIEAHPHYLPARGTIERIHNGAFTACISGHGLAEAYSVLTRTPFKPRVLPMEGWQFLSDNVFPRFEIVSLQADSYKGTIDSCARRGWHGGRIYDAIHLCCARQASCDRIYTFKVRHFQELAPDLSDRIGFPPSSF